MCILYIIIIVFYLKVDLIIICNKQKLMIIKELFEGPVGDYCIARNTIKCLYCSGPLGSWTVCCLHLKNRVPLIKCARGLGWMAFSFPLINSFNKT